MRALVWLLAAGLAQAAAPQACEISNYVARFELSEGSASADVTLDITYHVLSGEKSEGFKYVGDYEPANVRVVDETGASIAWSVQSRREYQISWTFPPVGSGYKRAIVRFRLPGVLKGSREEGNEIDAEWAGVFKMPVRRAVYEVVFPPGVSPKVKAPKFSRTRAGSQEVLSWEQKPLAEEELSLRFTPGIADAGRAETSGSSLGFGFGVLIVGIIVILGITSRSFRKGDSNGSWATGGCGGGGCGGGGCGGGCGG